MNPWIYMLVSIVFEVSGTTCLKLSEGFTRVTPSMLTLVFYLVSFVCFAQATRKIELSIAYSVWCGMGTALIAIIGFVYFRDAPTTLKIGSILLIITGVIGLNLAGSEA